MPLRPLIICLVIIGVQANAQNHIKGRLLDSLSKPLSFCNIGLIKAKDSSVVKGNMTNEDGKFIFNDLAKGEYKIKIMHAAGSIISPETIILDSLSRIDLPDIIFKHSGKNLDEVTINAIKKPIEFKNGNIIINVEGSALAVGNTVYDLLLRLPGVMVIDNNVSIQGNSGVRFYFDNRQQQLQGAQMINLLKTMPASSVEKIEIIKVPPVKYDAAGSAGIINIVTKRAKITGFSGNVTSAYTQAYFGNGNTGLSLNYKGKKINIFSGMSVTDESYKRLNYQDRHVFFNGNDTYIYQHYDERQRTQFGGANLGADWFIDSKNILGCKVSAWTGLQHDIRNGYITVNNSDLGYDYYSFGYDRKNPWYFTNTNLNFEHKFDTLGSRLLISADYNYNNDYWDGNYFNYFYDLSGGKQIPSSYYRSDNKVILNMASAKFDLEKQFKKQWKLEAGSKINYTDMQSDYGFTMRNDTMPAYVTDSSLTNTFNYNEVISAAYLNIQKSFKKINFQAGARCENTEINTLSPTSSISYHRSYLNIFPVASIDWNPHDHHSFQLSYNRRIDRPSYNQFNPYRLFRNYLIYQMGNPNLKPMYYNSYNINYNYKGIFNNSFSYHLIKDIIYDYDVSNDTTKERVSLVTNFDHRNVFAWDMFFQKNIFSWWITSLNTSLIYFTFKGNIYNQDYKASQYSYNIYNNNQFILPRNFKIETTFSYNAPWLILVSNMKSRWNLDAGIKKNLMKNNLTIAFNCSDIFFTSIIRGSADFANIHQTWRHLNDSRRFRFSVSYNFGQYKVRQRSVSSAEESKRLNH